MKKERITWIDAAKIIAMFSVILGHTKVPQTLLNWLYSFHLPLFFILSGAAYGASKKRKQMKCYQYIIHRAKGLLLPYFTLSFLMLLVWCINFKILGATNATILSKIKGIFISNEGILTSPTNATWFLTTLFLVTIVYFIIERFYNYDLLKIELGICMLSAIGFIFASVYENRYHFPWHVNVVPIGIFFFSFGVIFVNYYVHIIACVGKYKNLYAILLVAIGSVAAILNKKISMHGSIYNNIGLFLIGAIFISVGIILFVCKIPQNKVVEYIASCSIVVVAVHCPVLRFLEQFSDVTKQFTRSHQFLTAIIMYISSIIVASIIKVCCPFIIGEKYPSYRKQK